MAIIECKNLSIGYGSKIIQENLNLKIEKGDYYFIIGENGSGKSTLMKTMLGFQKPISGDIEFSKEISAQGIGYLPQQNAIQKDFPAKVIEIVMSGFQGKSGFLPFYKKAQYEEAFANMKELEILDFKNKPYKELSGGQQQRVLLARALCAAKDILLLDEPVKGFDPKITQEMYDLIQRLNKNGMTIIMISHDLAAAEKYATGTLKLERYRRENND